MQGDGGDKFLASGLLLYLCRTDRGLEIAAIEMKQGRLLAPGLCACLRHARAALSFVLVTAAWKTLIPRIPLPHVACERSFSRKSFSGRPLCSI